MQTGRHQLHNHDSRENIQGNHPQNTYHLFQVRKSFSGTKKKSSGTIFLQIHTTFLKSNAPKSPLFKDRKPPRKNPGRLYPDDLGDTHSIAHHLFQVRIRWTIFFYLPGKQEIMDQTGLGMAVSGPWRALGWVTTG